MFTLNAALLDACVLAALAQGDSYGYELTTNIKAAAGVSESTLYPVLKRLQKDGCLVTYDEAVSGRNRRYYRVTEAGRQKLAAYRLEWASYKRNVDRILSGAEGRNHE